MAAVISLGELERVTPSWTLGPVRSGVRLYDSFNYDYAALYRMQPNVRTCVDFLARNIAQLGLHVFRRISDTDRERLTEHGLALTIAQPLPAFAKVTRYRLIEGMMSDLGIYFNAYWLKLRQEGRLSLLRLPPEYVKVEGGLLPRLYRLTVGGLEWKLEPDDVVHFRGYNPENPIFGLSPLETLRRVLAEEHAAGKYREGFWQNAARQSGIVRRPLAAPEWSETARERFIAEFEQMYGGADNSGKTAVLEEGMEWEANSFNAQESEYLGGRKLTREECARAYHIPLPMVGILDHATFSNIREQHKHLYQDALGPWLVMVQEDVELQLLPEFEDTANVYVEFNIAEKLRGDFEDQTKALQSAVGRPWLTADEARAMMNRPSMGGDAAQLVTPLNMLMGGQAAAPRDSGGDEGKGRKQKSERLSFSGVKGLDSFRPQLRAAWEAKWREVLTRHYRRQEAAMISRMPRGLATGASTSSPSTGSGTGASTGSPSTGSGTGASTGASTSSANGAGTRQKVEIGGVWWDAERWNSELGEDLLKLNLATAVAFGDDLAAEMGAELSEEAMVAWLTAQANQQAEGINGQTMEALAAALNEPDPQEAAKQVFTLALTVWAARQAGWGVLAASSFGASEAARSGGLRNKTWRTNSSNPRDLHKAMAGETVGIRERFSNGMKWPGDPAGGAENVAHCMCSVEFAR